ncbi:MAG: phasin family protein [Thiotrichaceae bacterium]|nr:phasin family protein [Thiotrichaceae bacterium]
MQNDLIQQWTELNKTAIAAIKELGDINSQAMNSLAERQIEMMNLYMEGGSKQLEVASTAQNPQDVVAAQSRLFTELNEKLMDNARQTTEVLADVKGKLAAWVEKGMETAKATTTAAITPKK